MNNLELLSGSENFYRKVQHDRDRFFDEYSTSSPDDTKDMLYAAMDFFLTAYHQIEWYCGADKEHEDWTRLRQHPLMKIAGQIANGTKHFKLDPKRHQDMNFRGIRIVIELDGDAKKEFGQYIEIGKLVKLTMNFWDIEMEKNMIKKSF